MVKVKKLQFWGHPHSSYAQMGSTGVKEMRTIAYKGGGGCFKAAYIHTKKFFLDHSTSKLFFCTKEAITLPYVIVYRKV